MFDLVRLLMISEASQQAMTGAVLIDRREALEDRLRFGHVKRILEEARKTQGLRRLDAIEYAVLERSGSISSIPRR